MELRHLGSHSYEVPKHKTDVVSMCPNFRVFLTSFACKCDNYFGFHQFGSNFFCPYILLIRCGMYYTTVNTIIYDHDNRFACLISKAEMIRERRLHPVFMPKYGRCRTLLQNFFIVFEMGVSRKVFCSGVWQA